MLATKYNKYTCNVCHYGRKTQCTHKVRVYVLTYLRIMTAESSPRQRDNRRRQQVKSTHHFYCFMTTRSKHYSFHFILSLLSLFYYTGVNSGHKKYMHINKQKENYHVFVQLPLTTVAHFLVRFPNKYL